MNDPKAIWQSKTLWLNAGLAVAAYVLNNQGVLAGVDPQAQLIILAVANIANRFLTSQPVTLT